ncbi:MAG TPA: hypothetical protein VGV59_05850 [Pyrinomonadaceae bacterium]|nr:hypothetical protein [Pyrinomonadaceae bacterium]
MILALNLQASGFESGSASPLREKDVQRAEQVITKLRLLDYAARSNAQAFLKTADKLYPALFVTVAEMRPSDLKTDLDTAAFLYEEASRIWRTTGTRTADCSQERRDIYRPLCLELEGGTVGRLLVSKARLHTSWAEAVVSQHKGATGADVTRRLADMNAARANDSAIAAQAVRTLRTLEQYVNTFKTYADYQEQRTLAKVNLSELDGEFADALARAGVLIASMPRSPALYHLRNAYQSYLDGLFWSRKIRQSTTRVVSVNGFDSNPLADLRLSAEQVGYTTVGSWKKGKEYTRRAEHALAAKD